MSVKKKDKIDLMIGQLENLLNFENETERIEVKASFIQLDILDEVKKIMKEKNITRTDLAQKLNKSKSFVSQLFSGDKAINLKMVAQFQEIFNAKFIPSFKDYSEYALSKKYSKNDYVNNDDYVKNETPIFRLTDYEESKAA